MTAKHTQDETAIRQIVADLAAAWSAGDAEAWGAHCTDDIEHIVWNGLHVRGRDALVDAHDRLFETLYQGTTLNSRVIDIRFLRDDVAVAFTEGMLTGPDGERFQPETIPTVKPSLYLTKNEGRWQVEVFQNTPVLSHPGAAN